MRRHAGRVAAYAHDRRDAGVVYTAGMVQGIVLVTVPAASPIFTSPAHYGLTTAQYGTLFVPQVITAIAASLLGAGASRRAGTKTIYLTGLAANLTSMLLLLVSAVIAGHPVAYGLLLLATTSLGLGFGLTVPVLNSLTAALHPRKVDSSILVLNALLGLGTVLAPLFVAVFTGLGFWWGLPVTSSILLLAVLVASAPLPIRAGRPASAPRAHVRLPSRFWVYAGFITLYGACETVNGNWSSLTMTIELGASTTLAAIALTTFWAMVTLGRLGFAGIQRWFRSRWTYHVLPFLLAGAFVLISLLPPGPGGAALGVVAFGLAGLGCSALLPLTISFAQEEMTAVSASVTGGIIAFYQVGYGIAAFGVGPLHAAGVSLSQVYGVAALVALGLGVLSFAVAHRRPMPATLHPRPAAHVQSP